MNDFISTIRLALNEYFHRYSVSLLIHSVSVIFTPIRYSYVPGYTFTFSMLIFMEIDAPKHRGGMGNLGTGLGYVEVCMLMLDKE